MKNKKVQPEKDEELVWIMMAELKDSSVPDFEAMDEPIDPLLKHAITKYRLEAVKDQERDIEIYLVGNHYFVSNEGIFFASYDDELTEISRKKTPKK